MEHRKKRAAVGLSGGVDSSVAAILLKEEGYDVIGITMEIFDGSLKVEGTVKHACYGPSETLDVQAAASLCTKLDIPFYRIDLKKEYRDLVLSYVRSEYLGGRTPNPCVLCNQKLKFGYLLERARRAGVEFDYFATGHYARIEETGGRFILKKAVDERKDQTYFLYGLTPGQLSHILFPLGIYTKQQVRRIALSHGLESADQADSQDFIEGGDLTPLFKEEDLVEGDIVDDEGNILGKHRGIVLYTIGQRRGLGISSDRPLYVAQIDSENNRIVVSTRDNLLSGGFIASGLNLLTCDTLDRSYRVKAKIRLQHREADATLSPYDRGKAKVLFDEPQMAVTPGQSAVFYSGDTLLGGGVIERRV
jgi:tRNA-specific 2-thiouridylase